MTERKLWYSHSISSFTWSLIRCNSNTNKLETFEHFNNEKQKLYKIMKLLKLWKENKFLAPFGKKINFWHHYRMLDYCVNLSSWKEHIKVQHFECSVQKFDLVLTMWLLIFPEQLSIISGLLLVHHASYCKDGLYIFVSVKAYIYNQ